MKSYFIKQSILLSFAWMLLTISFGAWAQSPIIMVPKNGATGVDPRAYVYWSYPFENLTLTNFKLYVAASPTPVESVAPVVVPMGARTYSLGGLLFNQAYQVEIVAENTNPALNTTSTLFSFTTTNNPLPTITAVNKVLHLAADGSVLNASGVQAANGETVQTWVDQSASANNATPKAGIGQPVFVTNLVVGRPALQFTPNQLLQCVGTNAPQVRDYAGDFTWFCVGQANALAYYGFMGTRTLGAFAKGAYLGNANNGLLRYSNGLNASNTIGTDMTGALADRRGL